MLGELRALNHSRFRPGAKNKSVLVKTLSLGRVRGTVVFAEAGRYNFRMALVIFLSCMFHLYMLRWGQRAYWRQVRISLGNR